MHFSFEKMTKKQQGCVDGSVVECWTLVQGTWVRFPVTPVRPHLSGVCRNTCYLSLETRWKQDPGGVPRKWPKRPKTEHGPRGLKKIEGLNSHEKIQAEGTSARGRRSPGSEGSHNLLWLKVISQKPDLTKGEVTVMYGGMKCTQWAKSLSARRGENRWCEKAASSNRPRSAE